MRDLGAVLSYEEPCPISAHRVHAPPLRDHQRGVLMRRRDEARTLHLPSSRAPRARADDPVALLRLILRRVRQRAFVIQNPYVIPCVEIAAANVAKSFRPR
jgi:hypothetical protein